MGARVALAEAVANLQRKGINAAVRASAEAFAGTLRRQIRSVLKELSVDGAAPWRLFIREMKPKRQSDGPSFPFMLFGEAEEQDKEGMLGCNCQVCLSTHMQQRMSKSARL